MKNELSGKYIISLNNFSPENTLIKYDIWKSSSTYEMVDDIYDEKVVDIMQDKSDRYMYFIDSKKMKVKCWLNMIDFSRDGILPNATNNLVFPHTPGLLANLFSLVCSTMVRYLV